MTHRLVIVSASHTSQGGVESIIGDLCRELPSRGWETILALGRGLRFNDVARFRLAHPELPIVEVDGTKGTRQARVEALSKMIKELRPDVVFSARVIDAYYATTIAKTPSGSPRLAVAIRGYEPQYMFDAKTYRASIDLCVTSGNLIAEAAVRFAGLEPARVVSIPGSVREPNRASRPRVRNSPIRLGYVGRLAQGDKRIMDVVRLVELLDQAAMPFHLSLVGAGPEEGKLGHALNQFVAAGKVAFQGWKTREELYDAIYPNLDCVLLFSPAEGATISPREGMAHGAVPVVSRFKGLRTERQYVDGVNALTFPVGDMEAAVACIGRLMSEPGLMERLSASAINSQSGVYTLEGGMNAWAEAFDRCLRSPPMIGALPKGLPEVGGRLARYGVSPWLAQRVRDLFGRRFVHLDPGSEWPTGSVGMPPEFEREVFEFAARHEAAT